MTYAKNTLFLRYRNNDAFKEQDMIRKIGFFSFCLILYACQYNSRDNPTIQAEADTVESEIHQDAREYFTAYSVEEAMADPEGVIELYLRNDKQLTQLPVDIGKMVNLRVLNVSGTKIRTIPNSISNCKYLSEIIANASRITTIPDSIGELGFLRKLNFGYNAIDSIPSSLGQLVGLEELNLGSNHISQLPDSFAGLKHLTFCDVSDNELEIFPDAILGLEKVGNLWMHGNAFDSIPKEIQLLKNLHHFLVDAHEIKNIKEIEALIPGVYIIDEYERNKN